MEKRTRKKRRRSRSRSLSLDRDQRRHTETWHKLQYEGDRGVHEALESAKDDHHPESRKSLSRERDSKNLLVSIEDHSDRADKFSSTKRKVLAVASRRDPIECEGKTNEDEECVFPVDIEGITDVA